MARILSKESETKAKEIFIHRYFTLNMKGLSSENKLNDFFQECIDKKKMWTLLEKNFAMINCRNSISRNGAEVIIKWKNEDLLKV